ncbi:MAG: hypothetical protein ACYTHM_08155 [Planctomycetota bacterium]|jgi:hypothetical protein
METFLEILKWVGLVFLTAVIAGFGKILAEWIVKKRRHVTAGVGKEVEGANPGGEISKKAEKAKAKGEKKRRKEEGKRQKKG